MPKQLTPDVIAQTPNVSLADVTDQEVLLTELASLPLIDYDRHRASAAKLLGVRVSTLDAEIAVRRARIVEQSAAEQVAAATPEPWAETVDGAQLLDDLAAFYHRYVVLPEGAADMLALWTMHTYTLDAFMITPRLAVVSPQKRCGKTTLMELVDATAASTLSAANITTAALFRAIEQWRPTMLIDEADTFLRENEELRGVLNAGYRRATAYVVRNVPVGDSWEPRKFCVWGPVAIALIGSLPSTLADRSIHIRLRRKATRETVERLRLDRISDLTEELRRRCLRWAQDHLTQLKASDPDVPETLNDRAADNWRPLCAIADVAGGEWPQRVKKAIAVLAGADVDDDSVGVRLLEDIRQIFGDDGEEKIFSEHLVKALHGLEERPWSEWGQQRKPISKTQLAGLLRPFEIRSKDVRMGAEKAKGYTKDDFADAWERYLSPLPVLPAPRSETPRQGNNDAGFRVSQVKTSSDTQNETPRQGNNGAPLSAAQAETSRNGAHVSNDNAHSPTPNNACLGVSDQAPENVSDGVRRTPAPHNACLGVSDRGAGKREGQQHTGLHTGPPCRTCLGGTRYWTSEYGVELCAKCHPWPGTPTHTKEGETWNN